MTTEQTDLSLFNLARTRVSGKKETKPVVALAGNPNSGKTSLFNALTGLRYKVANYPGVTVEKKEGAFPLAEDRESLLLDLPGLYSLDGISLDEQIASQALRGELGSQKTPDLVIAVVDATNLERNLYLVSQLLDLRIPIIVALTMVDLAEKRGLQIRREILSRLLDTPVVPVVAPQNKGLEDLKREALKMLESGRVSSRKLAWLDDGSALKKSVEAIVISISSVDGFKDEHSTDLLVHALRMIEGRDESLYHSRLPESIVKEKERLTALGIDPSSVEISMRYAWVSGIFKSSVSFSGREGPTFSDRADKLLTHPVWGILSFLIIMGTLFQSIFVFASAPMDAIDAMVGYLGNFLSHALPPGNFRSLLVDGVVAGAGSVLVFVPQLVILFFLIGLLEDSGYLARAAFITDRAMRVFGLQGRAFVPLLSSFACAVPGIMATRTIPSIKERITTIMIAPLMSCSARLPVYSLLIAAFVPAVTVWGIFPLQGLTMLALYLLGIAGAMAISFILRKTALKGDPALFVMELPPFRSPSLKLVLRSTWDRISIFLRSAGTIILACSIVLWFMASYPQGDIKESYAGKIGHYMEPAIKPLGMNWEMGIAILSSFAAREVFVSTLGTVYELSDEQDGASTLLTHLEKKRDNGSFTLPTALSLLAFYVFACQCISTLAMTKREAGSWKWTAFMFIYLTLLAWLAAFATFNISLALL